VSETGKFVTKYRRIWQVPYEPGILKPWRIRTASKSRWMKCAPRRARKVKLAADGGDSSRWRRPLVCHSADRRPARQPVSMAITWCISMLPAPEPCGGRQRQRRYHRAFQADHRKAFSGMALLIVRSKAGETGGSRSSLRLKACRKTAPNSSRGGEVSGAVPTAWPSPWLGCRTRVRAGEGARPQATVKCADRDGRTAQ